MSPDRVSLYDWMTECIWGWWWIHKCDSNCSYCRSPGSITSTPCSMYVFRSVVSWSIWSFCVLCSLFHCNEVRSSAPLWAAVELYQYFWSLFFLRFGFCHTADRSHVVQSKTRLLSSPIDSILLWYLHASRLPVFCTRQKTRPNHISWWSSWWRPNTSSRGVSCCLDQELSRLLKLLPYKDFNIFSIYFHFK